MKNFQQNLLIALGLGLCVLCGWQWYVQTVQRQTIQQLNQMVYDRNNSIQGYTNTIITLNSKIDDMDSRITQLKSTVSTNAQTIAAQGAQITQLRFDNETFTNEIGQYKVAVSTLESRLTNADDNIDKQNQTITNLLSQRNDLVQRYDTLATNRNDIVLRYNALVKQQGAQKDNQ
jgi:chromosome segregation ATPase